MYDKPLSQLNFTAFDFETTGLSPSLDKIIELGAVRIEQGELGETFHALVNPGIPIPGEATAVHGITNADVQGKPLLPEVLPRFLRFIEGSILIAHNASFDMGFLQHALKANGLPQWKKPVIDTIPLARKVFPSRGRYGLQTLAQWLGIDPGKAHNAQDDAILCARLFQICIIRWGSEGELTLGELGCRVHVTVP